MLRTPRTAARFEALFWAVGIAVVAIADPAADALISVCLFDWIGDLLQVSFCPGCGLGHAVGWLVRGELSASFAAHPLGLPALLILGGHTVRLLLPARGPGSLRKATS